MDRRPRVTPLQRPGLALAGMAPSPLQLTVPVVVEARELVRAVWTTGDARRGAEGTPA